MASSLQAGESLFVYVGQHMGQVMDEILRRRYFHFSHEQAWTPPVNLYETADAFLVCMELAGMAPEQIDVRAQQDMLIISGHRGDPRPSGEAQPVAIHLMEIDSGRFCRRVEIPPNAQTDRIEARYRDGYLWIRIPKQPR